MTAAAPTELPTKPVSAPAAAPAPAVVMTDPATAASAGAASPPAYRLAQLNPAHQIMSLQSGPPDAV